jgi:hypothetical protein
MTSLIWRLLAMSIPLIAMVATSVTIDPANLFHEGPERRIAAMLLAGKPVAGLIDYDDRLVQRHYIAGLSARRDVVVLGSSRTMQVRATGFPGRSFFNHSLTGGILDDYIAIARDYAARGLMPRLAIIGLDPWLLSAYASRPSESRVSPLGKLLEAVSPSYFQAALRSLKAYGGRPAPRAPLPDEAGGTTLADGSRVYPRTIRERTTEAVRADAIRTAAGFDDRLRNFRAIDEALVGRLESLVDFLRARGTEVELLLVPYHRVMLDRYRASEEYDMVFAAERRFRDLAAKAHVAIRGGYDPAACGCDDSEFLDAGHPRDTCVTKILQPPMGQPVRAGARPQVGSGEGRGPAT